MVVRWLIEYVLGYLWMFESCNFTSIYLKMISTIHCCRMGTAPAIDKIMSTRCRVCPSLRQRLNFLWNLSHLVDSDTGSTLTREPRSIGSPCYKQLIVTKLISPIARIAHPLQCSRWSLHSSRFPLLYRPLSHSSTGYFPLSRRIPLMHPQIFSTLFTWKLSFFLFCICDFSSFFLLFLYLLQFKVVRGYRSSPKSRPFVGRSGLGGIVVVARAQSGEDIGLTLLRPSPPQGTAIQVTMCVTSRVLQPMDIQISQAGESLRGSGLSAKVPPERQLFISRRRLHVTLSITLPTNRCID